jgi:hypothetical protein
VAAGVAILALAVTGCSDSAQPDESHGSASAIPAIDPGESIIAPDAVTGLMAALPQRTLAPLPSVHLTDGVIPPTNRWYSSLAFGDELLPVFASPLSFRLTEGGFSFGLPRVEATENTIFGAARDDVTVSLDTAPARPLVSAADPVAVTLEYASGNDVLGHINLAEGWPVVAFSATQATTATLSVSFAAGTGGASGDVITATVDGTEYAVRVDGGTVSGTTLSLDAGGTAQFFAVPTGGDATVFAAALGEPVSSVFDTYSTPSDASAPDAQVSTTLSYLSGEDDASQSSESGPTVIAAPLDRVASADCALGTYDTIHGMLSVCAQSTLTWSYPAIAPTMSLDLEGITDQQRSEITDAVHSAATNPVDLPADTYFGSKGLYRLANLMLVAQSVDADDEAEVFRTQLTNALKTWTEPAGCEARADRCYLYDPQWRGVVGLTTAFGSEEFNDHHFHYGYLLYAAAVAGADDPDLVEQLAPVLDAVAADIGAFPGSEALPERRAFDPYVGHSWASGTSPFGDGNNQESSSEAVTAYMGLAAWATVRGDAALEASAQWMTASEADASTRLWLRPDLTEFTGFDHSIVSLEWGGKRDYATWFSAEPGAMLGIQLIPAPPASAQYLAPADEDQAQAIRDAVAEGTPAGYDTQFGDFMLMYLALAGADDAGTAWDEAVALEPTWIDDGNSRAYMLAWIAAVGKS